MSIFTRCLRTSAGLAGMLAIAFAHASIDVNTSNEAALESISGIGAAKARAIVKERESNGPFKSDEDLAARISGLGSKSVAKLRENGLTIGSASGGGGGAVAPAAARGVAGANAAAPGAAQGSGTSRTTSRAVLPPRK
ncbi:ComEA family DNA-binding protein [Pararobbsia silviterrae]|uniref:Helix-hairpin-helix domain-containing protein n=1 Tax=Pararobbsia silviterrae TaxID=1792498 RepID=A0A494YAJ1_9BURK|nr:helix-hairpin-helix domain-containing protein [Pararobbsia silviterrae]RKP59446.1 helix-hairpin-helix domain-containing protein [Pararobbsia silviterrae]